MRKLKERGFTLIELMIAVAVVAILAAVAYPSYTQHIRKGNRSAAQAQMLDLANRQQQYLLVNKRYATKAEIEGTGYTLPKEVTGKYTWDMEVTAAGSVPAFTVTFTAAGSQVADGNLKLNSQGAKEPASHW
jgi:type IV pilus assembly protein PilE